MESDRIKRFKSGSKTNDKVANASEEDEVIARLNKMSMEERDEGLHDLHGIADLPDETPEMIDPKIDEMNAVLSSPYVDLAADASAYRKAVSMDSDYVEELKLPCLRAMQYDARKAAALTIRFFERKLVLFGESKLVKEIGLGDLTEEDRDALNNGMAQLLPHFDRAGRIIFLVWGKVNQQYDIEVVLRVIFFIVMIAVRQDEEGQRRGAVHLMFAFGQKQFPASRIAPYHYLWGCLPMRLSAIHICQDPDSNKESVLNRGYKAAQVHMQSKLLVRTRVHYGSELECMYTLMTFGILREAIPLTNSDGSLNLEDHHEMIRFLESTQMIGATNSDKRTEPTSDSGLDCREGNAPRVVPGRMDIIMGRGRRKAGSDGTWLMYRLVAEMKAEYEAARKSEKTKMAETILERLKEKGCRFLKEKTGDVRAYEVCDDAVARAKIAHSFRNERSRSKLDKRSKSYGEE